jgi:hypothetical protein
MKVVLPKNYKWTNKRVVIPPAIGLERYERKEVPKHLAVTFKLKNDPNAPDSATYEISLPKFRQGSPEAWLKLEDDFRNVFRGQGATTGPQQYAIVRRVLDGDALSVFNSHATELGNETLANLPLCFAAVAKHVFPHMALRAQRRFMTRDMRKPKDMIIAEFVARVNELQMYLPRFPVGEGQPQAQPLPVDLLQDVIESAAPNKWQRQLMINNFNHLEADLEDLIEQYKRFEMVEEMDGETFESGTKSKRGREHDETGPEKAPKSSSERHQNKRTRKEYYCAYHGTNSTHSTDDCKVVKSQMDNMKRVRFAAPESQHYKNKTYDRKAAEKKKNEIHAMIADAVDRALKKSTSGKKRKSKREDLENFNYEEFEKLSISSHSDNSCSSSNSDSECNSDNDE